MTQENESIGKEKRAKEKPFVNSREISISSTLPAVYHNLFFHTLLGPNIPINDLYPSISSPHCSNNF